MIAKHGQHHRSVPELQLPQYERRHSEKYGKEIVGMEIEMGEILCRIYGDIEMGPHKITAHMSTCRKFVKLNKYARIRFGRNEYDNAYPNSK